ncbi:fatty acid desaturase [Pseudosulfitobacter sp. SM2401]|uniref:fatty acid desaturase n=1 Tax=Pseudosulfitobacter sp. SM2401 TaxID=3350098 RepID=UPI0036F2EE00
MDHRSFLKSLTPELRNDLNAKSDVIGLMHLAAHWGLIALIGTLIVWQVPGWPVLMLIQGILLVFLFTLLHETCHLTPFATPMLNRIVGAVCGCVLVLPSNWFRYFHFAHHRYTQVQGKDPELAFPKPETWGQYITHVSGLPTYASHFKTLVHNARGHCDDDFVPTAKLATVRKEAQVLIGIYALIALVSVSGGFWQVLYIWIIPMLLGQPFLRLYLMAEHGRCPLVADMFANTRTTFTSFVIRKLAWNMPYHAEHHASPTVPFHRLQDLHAMVMPHLKVTEHGYSRFHWKMITRHLR